VKNVLLFTSLTCFAIFASFKFATDSSGQIGSTTQAGKVIKSDQQWRQQLTPDEYRVTRKKGTEQPFTGKHWNSKNDGIYTCKCCGQPLFDSKTKFKSGTGWPSYFQPIFAGAVNNIADFSAGMQRTEVTCSRCDAHLGHVFDDGPQPTGLRYCMNSVALGFKNRPVAAAQPAAIGAQPNLIIGAQPQPAQPANAAGYPTAQKLLQAFSNAVAENSREKFLACVSMNRLPESTKARLRGGGQLPSGVTSMALTNRTPALRPNFEYNINVVGGIEVSFQDPNRKITVSYGQVNGRYFLASTIPKGQR